MSTTELGTLVVVVLKARNLIDKHSFYKQDVYTKVTLHDNTQQTRVDIKGGQHPEWDDELRFPVLESKKKRAKILEIVCWSKEPRVDEIIGKGELDITETLKTGEFDDWIPLTTTTGTQRGEVYLEMTFYAAGPPPALTRRPSKLNPATRLSRPSQAAQQYHHPGLQSVLSSTNGSHLTPPLELQPGRISPRPESPLPPLPEESGPAPVDVPSILRPGAGRVPGRYSPQPPDQRRQSTSRDPSPRPPHSRDPSPRPSYEAHTSTSVPAPHAQPSLDFTPEILRAGPSRAYQPVVSRTTSQAAEYVVASLPSAAVPTRGHTPISSPEPAPYQITFSPAPQPQQQLHQHPQNPVPIPVSAPPANPPPPAPTPSYSVSSWQQQSPAVSQTQPPSRASTYVVDTAPPASLPGFAFPTPQVPAPAYNQPVHSQSVHQSPANSPPAHTQSLYTQPPVHIPPAHAQSLYNQPVQNPPVHYAPYPPSQPTYYPYQPTPHARPYPYNYPPPPRDPDLDAPELTKKERYMKPLPLPDEPEGGRASPPTAHAASASHQHQHQDQHVRSPSRDELAAQAIERERELEKERQRKAQEQEEIDREIAMRLDMELNLAEVDPDERGNAEGPTGQTTAPAQADMPGSWYRHRVEV